MTAWILTLAVLSGQCIQIKGVVNHMWSITGNASMKICDSTEIFGQFPSKDDCEKTAQELKATYPGKIKTRCANERLVP